MAAKTVEQRAAELVARLEQMFEGDDSLPKLVDRVKAVQSFVDEIKGLDPKKIATEVERLKAGQDALTQKIRTSKRGFYVPGIEDEKFSLLKAFVSIRTGNWKGAEREQEILKATREKAGQVVGDDNRGGAFVPDQVIPDVIGAIYTQSQFISLQGEGSTRVSVLEGLTGGTVTVPKFDGGLIAYWIGEEDEYAESETEVGDMTMTPKKLGILVRMTDSMRRLQGYGFENLLRQDLIRAAAKKLDWTIAYGKGGDHMPRGIMAHQGIKVFRAENSTLYTMAAAKAIADWDGGEVTFEGLSKMLLALEEDDIVLDSSHVWMSSPRYWQRLANLRTSAWDGQDDEKPYILGAPMLTPEKLSALIGPFARCNQISSALKPGASIGGTTDSANSKYTDIIGGNLNNVVVGRWGGLEIEDDAGKGKGFTSDHTYVKCRLYADVGIRQERSIIVCPDAKTRD